MATAKFFGTQFFKTSDEKQDKQIIYKFSSKKDLEVWKNSDMTPYVPGGVDKKYSRQAQTAKQAEKAVKAGAKDVEFKSSDFAISGAHAHIKHTDPKNRDHFGVVVRFENKKQLAEFQKRNASYYKDNLRSLKNTDNRVIAANVNGATLNFTNDKRFDSQVKMALASYHKLDPSRNHLAMISQKGDKDGKGKYAKPEVYSFDTKSYRDYFVNKINGANKLPIVASKLQNFHPIAVDKATKDMILQGTLSDHFQHKDEYLSINNSNHKSLSSVASKQMISQKEFDKQAQAGDKDFTSKDLRGVDFRGHNLKGMDFSNSSFQGQKLDGLDFTNVKATRADFSKTSLNGTKFDGAALQNASFKNANAKIAAVSFKSADLSNADMKYMDVPKADMRDSMLTRANMYKSNMKEAATLGAKVGGTEMNFTNLEGAKMDNNFAGYKGTSFTGANLKGTSLENTPLAQPQKQTQAAAKSM